MSSGTNPPASANGAEHPRQVVTGVVPPQLGEAIIREVWPSVLGAAPGSEAVAGLAQALSNTIVLRPVAWALLLPLFVKKITPFLAKRYVLTNRRLKLVRFGRKAPYREIPLAEIDTVRVVPDSVNSYYRAGKLEVLSKGQVALELRGVPEPESFRLAILNACGAWAPVRPKGVMPAEKDAAVQGAR
ncbi:MAG TPA: hypothetical protein VJ739_07420 [Gemmataceae bacterium]|nr:hypothetical protein [Gemmataceae bacterium]